MSENKHETVAAVVVTYNRKELLRQCLGGILAQTRPVDAIYVVDNASTDGTDQIIATEYADRVIYERLPQNPGSAGGFHHGMKRAYEDGHDWIWVMDDDVRPSRECLHALLSTEGLSERRVVAPIRLTPSGALAEAAGIKYDMERALISPFTVKESVLARYRFYDSLPDLIPASDLAFEGPLFPATAIAEVGYPNAEFFIFGDDTDYSLRLRAAGIDLFLVKAATMTRLVPWPPTSATAWKTRFVMRNMLWLSRRHGHTWAARHVRPLLWTGMFVTANLVKLRWIRKPSVFHLAMKGLIEGLIREPGGAKLRCKRPASLSERSHV
jgi:GT2 family glycosyltransferase